MLCTLWMRPWIRTSDPWTSTTRRSARTRSPRSCIRKCAPLFPRDPDSPAAKTILTGAPGTAHLFMNKAPYAGWRHVEVTARRTKLNFAHILKDLVDVHLPQTQRIALVCDNLNTHKPSVLDAHYDTVTAAASLVACNGRTPTRVPAGSTSRRSRSMCSNDSPWPGASPTPIRCVPRLWPGQNNAISWAPL